MSELQAQLEDLQTRFAFQEDLVQALNQQVAEQAATLARLQQEQRVLLDYLRQLSDSLPTAAQQEPPPPHY